MEVGSVGGFDLGFLELGLVVLSYILTWFWLEACELGSLMVIVVGFLGRYTG